jgi:hypothetical protein
VTVTMKYRGTCAQCGVRLRGIYVASVRVNKASLRTTRGGLMAVDRTCFECGAPNYDGGGTWALDAESQAKVAAARERKGWAS